MKKIINVDFRGYACYVSKSTYKDGQTRLSLCSAVDDEDNELFEGMPVAEATLNLTLNNNFSSEFVVLKDYSENEGMLDVLMQAGVVEPTGKTLLTGYVSVPIVRVLI